LKENQLFKQIIAETAKSLETARS